MAQHVLPAVEHALALLGVQLVDEVRGVVLAAALVPAARGDTGSGRRRDGQPAHARLDYTCSLEMPVA